MMKTMKTMKATGAALVTAALVLACPGAWAGYATTVTVPGNACGNFGSNAQGSVPLVQTLTYNIYSVSTFTIKASGSVNDGAATHGPNGAIHNNSGMFMTPLQEVNGTEGSHVSNLGALIGAYVPLSLTKTPGFVANDATKIDNGAGIPPNLLFFVGAHNTIALPGPGVLYLGINDWYCSDNAGAYTVTISNP